MLHYAVLGGDVNLVKFLIENGANKYISSATSGKEETAPMFAKSVGKTELLEILSGMLLFHIKTLTLEC